VDDDVAHERLALWPVDLDTWVVRSPDGDMWPEDLSGGDPSSGPMLSRPARRRMAKKGPHAGSLPPVYRFRERLEGPSLKTAVVRGLVAATEVVELERTPVVTHFVDEDGERLPLDVAFGATISPLMRRAIERMPREPPAGSRPAAPVPLPDVEETPPPPPAPRDAPPAATPWRAAAASDTPRDEVWIFHEAGPSAGRPDSSPVAMWWWRA